MSKKNNLFFKIFVPISIALIIIFVIFNIRNIIMKVSYDNILFTQKNITSNASQRIKNEVFSVLVSSTQYMAKDSTVIDFCTTHKKEYSDTTIKVLNIARELTSSQICYILDTKGTAIACSLQGNKLSPLLGKNFSFRPYFKSAIKGNPSIYPAIGVTTNQLGLFSSAPIYSKDNKIIGVAVIKDDLSKMTRILKTVKYNASLINDSGVIFASNKKNLLYKYAYPISKSKIKSIVNKQELSLNLLKPLDILINKNSKSIITHNNSVAQSKFLKNHWSVITSKELPNYYQLTLQQETLILIFSLISIILFVLVIVLYFNIKIKQKAQKHLQKLFEAVEQTDTIIMITDAEGNIEYINSKFEPITGYSRDEMFGKKPNILNNTLNSPESCSNIWKIINSGKEWRGEFCNERKDGTAYWESNLISPVKDNNSKIIGFIVIKEDITVKKSIEKKLKLYATTDEMTGTLNRRTGLEFLNNLIKNEENYMVVGFIDVNGLKEINDTLGHSFGDDLIISCVNIFNKNLSKNDKLCRLGGDEFLIILPYCTLDKAEELWSRIIKDFEKINLEGNKDFIISVSHGFFEYSVDTQISIDNLISIADKKMYEEKKFIKEKLKSTIK